MEIRILGCSGGRSPGLELSSYLVDDALLVDTGGAASSLDFSEQEMVSDVLLTHAHLDHILGLGFLYQNTAGSRVRPLEVYATEPVMRVIRERLLIPELIPEAGQGGLAGINFHNIALEIPFRLGRYEVEALPVDHTAGSVGFRISDSSHTFIFTGDTGPKGGIWEWIKQNGAPDCLIAEVSFPDHMEDLANLSKHLTPKTLVECLERAEFPADRKVHVAHLKPAFLGDLYDEIESRRERDLVILRRGDLIKLDPPDRTAEARQESAERKVADKIPEFDRGADLYRQRAQLDKEFGVSARAGEVIFEQGDSSRLIYIIREGKVRIMRKAEDLEKTLGELGPGDFFGEMAVLNNRTRSATAIAKTDVKLLAFDPKAFQKLVLDNFGVALRVIRTLAGRLQDADSLIENLMIVDPESKAVNTLLHAAYDQGIETEEGVLIRTTAERISDRSGVILSTLRNIFSRLVEGGLIVVKRESIIIPNQEKLRRFIKFLELNHEFVWPD